MTALSSSFVAGAGPGEVHLRLIATTDVHAALMPWDYFSGRPAPGQGLAHTAALIARARAEAANSLLLDNGDFLQGTPLADIVARRGGGRRPHAVIAAFNALGYDAATLGNHEFNFGLPFLMRALADASFPVVSANAATRLGGTPTSDETLVRPFALLERRMTDGAGRAHDLRVGIIGFVPPQTAQWDRQNLSGRVMMRDIIEAAQAWVPRMRAEGADIVVALSHSGIGPARAATWMENASTALAALDGIDAVIAGHSHLVFPAPGFPAAPGVDPALGLLSGKPAVMPGHSGRHIGIIDLALRRTAAGWSVIAHRAETRGTAEAHRSLPARLLRATAAPVRAAVRSSHRATLAWARKPIAQTEAPLTTLFALVSLSPALRLVAEAQRAHVRRALAGTDLADLPLLSAVSPFKAGGRGGPDHFTIIPAGPLTRRHIADLYVFPNELTALKVTGADVARWLERASGLFHRIAPGARDADLIDPAFPVFNFDQIDGLTWRVDLSTAPDPMAATPGGPGCRIRDIRLDGRPLDLDAPLLVATNSYRSNGSGGFAGAEPCKVVLRDGHLTREVLQDHIARIGRVPPALAAPAWTFSPMPGTTVTFPTSPLAYRHLEEVAHLAPEPLGPDAAGFHRFRIAL